MPSKEKRKNPWQQITWKTDKYLLKGQGFVHLKLVYFFFQNVISGPRDHTASIQRVLVAAFPAVNCQGREADRSSSASPEIKNEWSYTSTLQYAFLAYTGENLIFLTYLEFCAVKLTQDRVLWY